MGRTVAIGKQNFEDVMTGHYFYVDKTYFIRDWWERGDDVTVITRPRRFGKTLTVNMLETFFSLEYEGRAELFEDLAIWREEKYRKLQGTYPVISMTFADVKEKDYDRSVRRICENISEVYNRYEDLARSPRLSSIQIEKYKQYCAEIPVEECARSIKMLSEMLRKHYGNRVLILLDEYDTPMHEAYVGDFWDEIVDFMRSLFNSSFKTNPNMQRALLTGITRVGKESMFSDFNNPAIASITSNLYTDVFGFTEAEVFAAMDEMGYAEEDKREVKKWYDGFTVGDTADIYNPWSIIHFLSLGKIDLYWSNSSANKLLSDLIQTGDKLLKQQFEDLIEGKPITVSLNEQIDFRELRDNADAIWSLLHAAGYLKVCTGETRRGCGGMKGDIVLSVTNLETQIMFKRMVRKWFSRTRSNYNGFTEALLRGDREEMEAYFQKVTLSVFSTFDGGAEVSESAPERFFHGFVLGLIVELQDRYEVKSNRESGMGRYDVMLFPKDQGKDDGIIIEFKVFNGKKETGLEQTAAAALKQIEDRHYEQELLDRGMDRGRIRRYAFVFRGKQVVIRD